MTTLNKNYTKIQGTDDADTIDDTNSTQIDEIEVDMTTIETDLTANQAATDLNTTHRTSDGTDHANVVLADTHRLGDGSDHANVALADTHRLGDGSDHADVATNTSNIASHTAATSAHGVSGSIVGDTDAQTLTNKTISGASNTLSDIGVGSLTNPYKARGYNDTGQSIPSGSSTKIEISTESYDINGDLDSTTNYRYSAPVTGYYMVSYSASLASTISSGTIFVEIQKNGTSIVSRGTRVAISGITSSNGADILYLVAGDYIELFVYQSSGAAQPLETNGSLKNFLSIHLLSK